VGILTFEGGILKRI